MRVSFFNGGAPTAPPMPPQRASPVRRGAMLRSYLLSDEARHDLFAQHFQVGELAVEVSAAEADPDLGGAGLRDLFDPRDPVLRGAGERPAAERVVGQAQLVHALGIAAGVQH